MLRSNIYIHDGKWHDVNITPKDVPSGTPCAFELTVDKKYSASVQSLRGHHQLELDDFIIGGIPYNRDFNTASNNQQPKAAVVKRDLTLIRRGFRGCLENIRLNSSPLHHSSTLIVPNGGNQLELIGSSGITGT